MIVLYPNLCYKGTGLYFTFTRLSDRLAKFWTNMVRDFHCLDIKMWILTVFKTKNWDVKLLMFYQ